MPEDEPGIAHMVPDVIKKCLRSRRERPLPIFGDGEQTRTLTHVDDIADGIVTAMGSPAGLGEDFNVSAAREMTVAEIARVIWAACGATRAEFALEHLPSYEVDVVRRWPSVEKARAAPGLAGAHRGRAGRGPDGRVAARAAARVAPFDRPRSRRTQHGDPAQPQAQERSPASAGDRAVRPEGLPPR